MLAQPAMPTSTWTFSFHPLRRRTLRALLLGALLVGGGAGLIAGGCSSVDNFFDCQAVCTKYRDCYDSGYDVGACRDRCRASSEADASFEQKANVCEACIDGMSCAGATFNCATDCAGVVPN